MMLLLGEDMKPTARLTLITLDRLIVQGERPSIMELANVVQLSRWTVMRNMDELENLGYVTICRYGGRMRNDYDLTSKGREYLNAYI